MTVNNIKMVEKDVLFILNSFEATLDCSKLTW